ncbi:MAG TPA: OmpA family protein [Gemmatimonadaceae bacterium]|nr:OmpA family protein [Gemmatimonadaceae bacterium]
MHRSSLVLVVTLVALAGCATMGRQVETDSGDLATDLEQARQDTVRARAAFDTVIEQRRAVDARTVAFEDSLRRAREAAAAAAAAARDSAQRVAAAAVTTPEPGGGERALSEAEIRIMTQQIYFATNSAHLTNAARTLLREKAAILARNPALTLTLTGHADARGAADYNQRLSERRAAAVQRFLLGLGIDAERLTSEGRGEEAPATEGSGESVWQRNRRVEFEIS